MRLYTNDTWIIKWCYTCIHWSFNFYVNLSWKQNKFENSNKTTNELYMFWQKSPHQWVIFQRATLLPPYNPREGGWNQQTDVSMRNGLQVQVQSVVFLGHRTWKLASLSSQKIIYTLCAVEAGTLLKTPFLALKCSTLPKEQCNIVKKRSTDSGKRFFKSHSQLL